MSKYRLTTFFVVISVITLRSAAFALNHLAVRTAENNLVDLSTEQSMRDASIIAGIVNRLIVDEGTEGFDQPARLAGVIPIQSQKLLDSLRVIDISLYDTAGENLWSTSAGLIPKRTVPLSILESTSSGEIASNLTQIEIMESAGAPRTADVVETFLPLLESTGDQVVGVIGITRDVTSTLTAQVDETRSSISLFTMVSLMIVFLILLVFILIADIKISRANTQKVMSERELNDRLMIDSLELKRIGIIKDRFLASITQELMTQLTSISAFTGILLRNRDSNLNETNFDQLQIMRRSATQLKTLLGYLLELSDMNDDRYELSYSRFNLRYTLDEVAEAFMPAVQKKDQKLNLEYDDAEAIVEADDTRIKQVVSNILRNAIMYSPEEAEITISTWVTDLLLTITVADNGIGISEADKQELFTIFFRADNETTRSVSGTGIGLVSSKQIVELHGGELTLTSVEGEGTTVSISLPRFRTRSSVDREARRAA